MKQCNIILIKHHLFRLLSDTMRFANNGKGFEKAARKVCCILYTLIKFNA